MPVSDFKKSPYDQAAIVGYNRLESSPVSSDYAKSLQAPVHDALWLLTRQWQMGEFEAEDAGSAIKAKVLANHHSMSHVFAGNTAFPTYSIMPLETAVEREFVSPDLALRIEAGNVLKQVIMDNMGDYSMFLRYFKLALLEKNDRLEETEPFKEIKREPLALELFDALKDKTLDGYGAYLAFKAWDFEHRLPPLMDQQKAQEIGQDFMLRFEGLYGKQNNQATSLPVAWQSEQLEYQFSLVNSRGTQLDVAQYSSGSLDWYDFDINKVSIDIDKAGSSIRTFVPTPVIFEGMPKPRWWEMEDSAVNFGDVNVKKTDLPTLLLLEFALIYGNDWMLIPYPMEVNSLCQIKGILVTDVFGCHTFIPPVNSNSIPPINPNELSWNSWAMFRHSTKGSQTASTTTPAFYLAPTLLKSLDSEPIESVSFLRDEMANLVWAFENIVPGAMGNGQKTHEMVQREAQEQPSMPTTDAETVFYYKLGTQVPFYQVPFLPVSLPLNTDPTYKQMRFQRGKMPQGSPPRGLILNEVATPFYIREEEIPRSGVKITRKWQRTRWVNGAIFQWVGREKETGKGEGNSGLQFDLLNHKPEYRPNN